MPVTGNATGRGQDEIPHSIATDRALPPYRRGAIRKRRARLREWRCCSDRHRAGKR